MSRQSSQRIIIRNDIVPLPTLPDNPITVSTFAATQHKLPKTGPAFVFYIDANRYIPRFTTARSTDRAKPMAFRHRPFEPVSKRIRNELEHVRNVAFA